MPYTSISPAPQPELAIFSVLGVQLQFLAVPDQLGSDLAVMRTVIPPGITIPLHQHADPEVFYVLNGNLEIFNDGLADAGWNTFGPGQIVSIAGSTKHAVRNSFVTPVSCLTITKAQLYSFFRTLAQQVTAEELSGRSTVDQMREVADLARKYGYWLATPEENMAIGISPPELQHTT